MARRTKAAAARDWAEEVDRFWRSRVRTRRYALRSPGVAQVTRCRVLAQHAPRGLRVRTERNVLVFEK